jgi:hypothetical protein
MQVDARIVFQQFQHLGGAMRGQVVHDAVQIKVGWRLVHQVPQERHEVHGARRVRHPPGHPAIMHVQASEQHHRAVAFVLELPAFGPTRPGRQGGIDPSFGLNRGLLVHRPHHRIRRRVQIQTAHISRFLPEIGVMAGHPRPCLPRFQIQSLTDPPDLRRRDRHPGSGHRLRQRLHRPASRMIRRRFGHRLYQQQHIIMAIHIRPARAFLIVQTGQSVLAVPAPPHRHLVVMHVHHHTDLTVRHPIGGQQHDPGPLRDPGLNRRRASPTLQHLTVTSTKFQRGKSHTPS